MEVWVICANDFPAGRAYRTEAEAEAWCERMNAPHRESRRLGMHAGPFIYYHCHRVSIVEPEAKGEQP